MRLSSADVEFLVAASRAEGFVAAGAAPLDAVVDGRLSEWLGRGYHGAMKYLERFAAYRAAPGRAFPRHRGVLAVFAEYGDVSPPEAGAEPSGRIARYALGRDYHATLKDALRRVQARIRLRFPDLWTRPFVDTGPLNEKLAAAVAGLGWVGKNTNLILRGRGSYGVLGLLLLGGEPPLPARVKDYCGRCDACLPACPTGAIVAPYVLDARRCISYLTIELRGPIPEEYRALIGDRIFGCDDCQEVCPWNRFATRTPEEPFRPRAGLAGRPLREWIMLDADGFAKTFADSAVLRAGRDAFVRNALLAAGNLGTGLAADEVLARAVREKLDDVAPVVRGAAAWALGRSGDAASYEALAARAALETDADVVGEIAAARAGFARR
jgi:epoxyqueuosine reductase